MKIRAIQAVLAVPVLMLSGGANAETDSGSLTIKPESVIGTNIGHFIDKQDKVQILQSVTNKESNKSTTWTSDSSGIIYTIKPDRQQSSKTACRDFTLDTTYKSFLKVYPGTACREKGGTWVVVK